MYYAYIICKHIGYTGPFCGVCADNYYYDSFNQVCTICESTGINAFAIVGIVLIALLSMAAFMYFTWNTVIHMLGFKLGLRKLANSAKTTKEVALGISNVQNKLKLLASMFQILINLPSVLVLVFPAVYSNVLSIFSIVSRQIFICDSSSLITDILTYIKLLSLCVYR